MVLKYNVVRNFSARNILVFIVILLFGIQLVSWAITSIFPTIPLFKSGIPLFYISISLVFIFLIFAVFKGEWSKKDILGFVIVAGVTTIIYIYGSTVFPAIFSILDNSAIESADVIQSALSLP